MSFQASFNLIPFYSCSIIFNFLFCVTHHRHSRSLGEFSYRQLQIIWVITTERRMGDWASTHRLWEKWASNKIGSSGEPLKAALLLNYDPTGPSRLLSVIAEQEGIKLKAVDLLPFLEFVKQKNWQMEFFSLGQNQYLVTSIHEHWFCARCVNTSKPGGEGVIVMQTGTFLLVAMYEGSLGSASQAMVAVDQLAWQMSRRTH